MKRDFRFQEGVVDTYQSSSGICSAPECFGIYEALRDPRTPTGGMQDFCSQWDSYICGRYLPRRRGDPKPLVVTEPLAQALFNEVYHILDGNATITVSRSTNNTMKSPQELDRSDRRNGSTIYFPDNGRIQPLYGRDPFNDPSTGRFPKIRWGNVSMPIPPSRNNDTIDHLRELADRYYKSCMTDLSSDEVLLHLLEEVNRPFHPLDSMKVNTHGDVVDTFKPARNSSELIVDDDQDMVTYALANLAEYGIHPLLKIGVGKSILDPLDTRIIIAPNRPLALSDAKLYRWPYVTQRYKTILEKCLPKLLGPRYARVRNAHRLPEQIIALEKKIEAGMPAIKNWRQIKKYVIERKAWNVSVTASRWKLDPLLHNFNTTEGKVDFLFESVTYSLWEILKKSSLETVRSYLLWQTFLQTLPLWDMPWVQEFRDFAQAHSDVRQPVPKRHEVCTGRVQRHFNHFINAHLLRSVLPRKGGWEPYFRVGPINATIGYPQGCNRYISDNELAAIFNSTYKTSDAPGNQGENLNQREVASLTDPETWTHLHDYFAFEKLHIGRTRNQFRNKPEDTRCQYLRLAFKKPLVNIRKRNGGLTGYEED